MKLKKGDRIKLVLTTDKYTELEPGALGTVSSVNKTPWERQISVDWDSGSKLMLLEGIDKYELVQEEIICQKK